MEGFFAKLTRRRLKRGVFRSLGDLQVAINRFLANSTPKPLVRTADPKRVLAAVKRGKEALESIHQQSRKSALKANTTCDGCESCDAWRIARYARVTEGKGRDN